jgi:amino acid transporter
MTDKQPRSFRLMAIIGLALSLVGLFGYFFIMRIANQQVLSTGGGTSVMILWALLCAVAFILCFVGFRKTKLGNKTIAITGMIIGLFVLVISIWSGFTIAQAASNPELQRIRERLGTGYDEELTRLKDRLERKKIIAFPIQDTVDTLK